MRAVGPGFLGGITLGDWFALLRENDFDVDPRYWLRAAVITMRSMGNSVRRCREPAVGDSELPNGCDEPPLFILGIWRSGTTHLQNLLACDARFATPNWFDASYPHSFLCGNGRPSRLESALVPRNRLQDNMRFGFDQPAEDEFALCTVTRRSPLLSWVFPRRANHYDRYLTLQDISPEELAAWKTGLARFVQKLAWKYRKPLVLKSPPHTARIRHLLELFPQARFIHIHRHPYAIYQSTLHLHRELSKYARLQNCEPNFEEHAVREYGALFDAYFEQRGLIPSNRLVELRFEDLEHDPVDQLQRAYESLGLPDFGVVEATVRQYIASLAEYRKNSYPEIEPDVKARLACEWRRCFQEWGYPSGVSDEPAAGLNGSGG